MILITIILVVFIAMGLSLGIFLWKKYGDENVSGVQTINLYIAIPVFVFLLLAIVIILYISK